MESPLGCLPCSECSWDVTCSLSDLGYGAGGGSIAPPAFHLTSWPEQSYHISAVWSLNSSCGSPCPFVSSYKITSSGVFCCNLLIKLIDAVACWQFLIQYPAWRISKAGPHPNSSATGHPNLWGMAGTGGSGAGVALLTLLDP